MNELLGSTALWPAEKIINHLYSADKYIGEQLSRFAGKSLELKLRSPNLVITVFLESGRVSLNSASAEILGIVPDASIAGEAADLFNALTRKAHSPLANNKIEIAGDAQFVQDLLATVQALDIQWADFFSPVTGDVVANELEQLGDGLRSWHADANNRIKRNVKDYMVEEAHFVPHGTEVEKFSNELDALRLKIDRVTAKAELLYQRLQQVND